MLYLIRLDPIDFTPQSYLNKKSRLFIMDRDGNIYNRAKDPKAEDSQVMGLLEYYPDDGLFRLEYLPFQNKYQLVGTVLHKFKVRRTLQDLMERGPTHKRGIKIKERRS